MKVKSQKSKVKSQKSNLRARAWSLDFGLRTSDFGLLRITFYGLRFTPYILRPLWTLDFGPWTAFAVLCLLLAPLNATAQTGGGAMISLYGVVQVEPGPDVVMLEVKGEMIRFAIQNVYCSDRGFSTGGFMTEITRKDPGLHLKGSEEWLAMLIKEQPSKRALQMTGVYYRDSRMFVLNKLTRFNGKSGLQQ